MWLRYGAVFIGRPLVLFNGMQKYVLDKWDGKKNIQDSLPLEPPSPPYPLVLICLLLLFGRNPNPFSLIRPQMWDV